MTALRVFVPHASDVLTNCKPHGDGLVAFEVVSRLAARGHEVHVAAPELAIEPPIPPNLHLYALGGANAGGLGRLRYMVAVRRLFERLHRERRIDVIHQLNPVFTGISLALIGADVPVVLGSFVADWPRGADPASASSAWARSIKRRIAALQQGRADALLVTTPAARERIVTSRACDAKIFTIPHGIDPERYEPQPEPPDAAAPTIVFLGGLEERKGIFTLLAAFDRVGAALPRARLIFAGTGWDWSRLEGGIAASRFPDRIAMIGGVPRAEVPALLRRSTLVCVPSFGEPFGMVVLEAMACGKPVIATAVGGPAHIVEPSGGRVVPPGSPQALADAIVEVAASPELATAMGRHNRALIERTYSWDRVLGRLESVYRSVLAAPQAS